MGSLMDLVAGDARDILLALSVDDIGRVRRAGPVRRAPAARRRARPDLARPVLRGRAVGDRAGRPGRLPRRADRPRRRPGERERIVERVDKAWIAAVAGVPDELLGALAGRWIGLLEEELGLLPREEKPWIRDLTAQIVDFARRSDSARDVVFAWAF